MGDEEDGGAGLAAVVGDVAEYALAAAGVEPGHGLVEDEHTGPHGDDARDGDAPLLPARELERGLFKELLRDADKARRLAHALVHLGVGELHVLRPEGDVPVDRLLKELILRVLEHQPDLESHVPRGLLRGEDVLALAVDRALVGAEQAVEVLYEGALARARVADDGHELARIYLDADVAYGSLFKGRALAVYVRQVLGFYDRVHSLSLFFSQIADMTASAHSLTVSALSGRS